MRVHVDLGQHKEPPADIYLAEKGCYVQIAE